MQHATLKRIHLIEQKIKNSLNNEDFVTVYALYKEFDKLIIEFTDTIKSEKCAIADNDGNLIVEPDRFTNRGQSPDNSKFRW